MNREKEMTEAGDKLQRSSSLRSQPRTGPIICSTTLLEDNISLTHSLTLDLPTNESRQPQEELCQPCLHVTRRPVSMRTLHNPPARGANHSRL